MFDLKKVFRYPEDRDLRSEELLNFALDHVPYYREHWAQYDPGRDCPIDERFAHMPILTKAEMRKYFPLGAVPDGKDIRQGLEDDEVEYTFTSGTTGDKVINLWNQPWWHASEMASWQLNEHLAKLTYPPKQATLASSLNVGISCEEDLPMDHRIMGNLLYLNEKANIICWKKAHFVRMAQELNSYRPTVLEANPSLLAKLCYWALDQGVEIASPDVITFTYELPSELHLKAIRQVFKSPLVSSYGTTETGFVMESCEDGRYHENLAYNRIEFIPLKEAFGGPDLGRMVVSTFGNPWACMLRFDVGDLVRISRKGCSCGRNEGFIAESIEGRVSNSTFAPDGRLVTTAMVDRAVSDIDGLREYDLSQTEKDSYVLKLAAVNASEAVKEQGYEALRGLYGPKGRYTVEMVDELLPGPAGKYRRTHTEFEFDEWALS